MEKALKLAVIVRVVADVAGSALLLASAAFAQTPYSPSRTADGRPDLGAVWSNADEDVTFSQVVDGETRTSPFTDPLDKILPFRDRASAMAWRDKYGVYMTGKPLPEFTLGPDSLPNRDRRLMAANAAAPPMTSQGYNDAYQIVQTPSHIAIAVEMMDEMRIVPMFADRNEAMKAHLPSVLQRWTGDPVGWWEGDTLVVETTSVAARQRDQSPMPMSADAKIIERFTRTGQRELLYQAEVTDLALYTRPWAISYTFHRTPRIWEYACHEGNYGMAGILSGERKVERDMAGKKPPN
ncbi:MAG: hypothetical protein QM773_14915 [Hyphomonadaceae bacterium]